MHHFYFLANKCNVLPKYFLSPRFKYFLCSTLRSMKFVQIINFNKSEQMALSTEMSKEFTSSVCILIFRKILNIMLMRVRHKKVL